MPTAQPIVRLLALCVCVVAFSAWGSIPAHAQPAPQYAVSKTAVSTSVLKPGESAIAAVVFDVKPGFHAQSHAPLNPDLVAFTASATATGGVEVGEAIFPPGKLVEYPDLGKLSVYDGQVVIRFPLKVAANAKPGEVAIKGTLIFQICDDKSCFPPAEESFEIKTTIGTADAVAQAVEPELFSSPLPAATGPANPPSSGVAATPVAQEQSVSIFGWDLSLKQDAFASVLLIAFLAGIVFNVMPCVLPVLPLKAIGFYESSQHNRSRTLLFGVSFSLGVIAVFAVLAVLVLLSKSIFGRTFSWGQQFSYPWFVWGIAILLAILGIGMMGAFALRLPTSVYGLNFRHDTLSGNFLWGGLTAILSTPCTAPLFPVVLGWAIGQPLVLGISVVLMVGVGMAFPYLLLSAFPEMARRFPRTGPASELVKQMMGFLLLASAAFFAGMQMLNDPNQWWLVFAVVTWGCLYLIVRTAQITKGSMPIMVSTAIAVAVAGTTLAVTLRLTNTNLGGAYAASSAGQAGAETAAHWEPFTPDALAAARKSGKTVLVKFTANWCLNCKFIEATVYHDPRALDALKQQDVVLLKADLTKSNAIGWDLLEQLTGGNGIPYTAIYRPGDDKPTGIASIYTTDTLLATLKTANAAAVSQVP